MKLYEHQAKGLLAAYGLPLPRGRLATQPDEAAAACRELGPVVVKAQVLAGGRGRAGGVRFAATPEEAAAAAGALLGAQVRGLPVERVLVEERLPIEGELYLGFAVDAGLRRPVLIASAAGGVGIEEVPERQIVREPLAVPWGLLAHQAREAARRLGLGGETAASFVRIALLCYRAFRELDAEILELNPLAVVGGSLVAADCRLTVDDDALFRHPELPRVREGTELEEEVRRLGLSYVELGGDIAVMANGAGITMATLDVLADMGGRPMNFLDVGGGAAAEPMAKALGLLARTRPRVIFVNIFGGITRCDDVARAILQAREAVGLGVPLVIRLTGTNEGEAVAMLRRGGLAAYRSMEEAARAAVAAARGAEEQAAPAPPGGEVGDAAHPG